MTSTSMPSGDGSASTGASAQQKIEFTGQSDDMWGIIFKNLIFNILTLSLYRFWGRTNVRRFIWESVRFNGDPLEYTGTGGELFKGFLIVFFVVFLPLFGLFSWAQAMMLRGDALAGGLLFLAVYVFFLWLLAFGIYQAQKYRMSRTVWRGIRGAQKENGVNYALAALGYGLLSVITFGLALPYMINKLWTKQSNNRRFGSGKFAYEGSAGPLFKAYLISFALSVVPFVLFITFMNGMLSDPTKLAANMGSFFFFYILTILAVSFAFTYFTIAQFRHFWSNSFFEEARFDFSGTVGGLIVLMITNGLIVAFTFGIAYPIAQMRSVRFIVQNTTLTGPIDFEAISQTDEDSPSFGEGLAEGFDMGTI